MDADTLTPLGAILAGAVGVLVRQGVVWVRARNARRAAAHRPPRAHLPSDDALNWRALFEASPASVLVLSPSLLIIAVSNAYCRATLTTRETLLGRHIFEAFPDRQGDPEADGVAHLRASLERVLATRRSDMMALQRYDIRDPSGEWEARWWRPTNVPVLGDEGEVRWILHHVVDVTESTSRAGAPLAR